MNTSVVIDAVSLARDPETTSGVLAEVFAHVRDLKDVYPHFDAWLTDRVLPGLWSGDRSILVEHRDGMLAGLAILKDDGLEKKLCCLRVLRGFQDSRGLGVRLFDKALDILETQKPLLSVSEERLSAFERIFAHFGFEQVKRYEGLYRAGHSEISFNGELFERYGQDCRRLFVQRV